MSFQISHGLRPNNLLKSLARGACGLWEDNTQSFQDWKSNCAFYRLELLKSWTLHRFKEVKFGSTLYRDRRGHCSGPIDSYRKAKSGLFLLYDDAKKSTQVRRTAQEPFIWEFGDTSKDHWREYRSYREWSELIIMGSIEMVLTVFHRQHRSPLYFWKFKPFWGTSLLSDCIACFYFWGLNPR